MPAACSTYNNNCKRRKKPDITQARLAQAQDEAPQRDSPPPNNCSRPSMLKTPGKPSCLPALKRCKPCKKSSKPTASCALAKCHGLDSRLAALWTRLHIEPGGKALEAALRERLSALEVSSLDRVRGLVGTTGEGPPAKLAFFSSAQAVLRSSAAALPRLADSLRLHDASLQAVLQDCYKAAIPPRP